MDDSQAARWIEEQGVEGAAANLLLGRSLLCPVVSACNRSTVAAIQGAASRVSTYFETRGAEVEHPLAVFLGLCSVRSPGQPAVSAMLSRETEARCKSSVPNRSQFRQALSQILTELPQDERGSLIIEAVKCESSEAMHLHLYLPTGARVWLHNSTLGDRDFGQHVVRPGIVRDVVGDVLHHLAGQREVIGFESLEGAGLKIYADLRSWSVLYNQLVDKVGAADCPYGETSESPVGDGHDTETFARL